MNQQHFIDQTRDFIRQKFEGESSGHDWWHIERVWRNAILIAQHESADLFVVELGALLHDIADWKFHDGDVEAGPNQARAWLASLNVDPAVVDHVGEIVRDISFKGAGVKSPMRTLEGKIVQDADRLDAIGAVGIARTFAYGGHKNRAMHDPDEPAQQHQTFEQYKNNHGTTINHFYEKLLLLKDLMNTPTARELAEKRHQFMEQFLEQFFGEWAGEK